MTFRQQLQCYAKLVAIGASSQLKNRSGVISRAVFLLMLLGIFSGIWQVFSPANSQISADNVWYLFVTELVGIFSASFMRQLRWESQSGMFSALLLKPIGILPAYLSIYLGRVMGSVLLMMILLSPVLYWYLGSLPSAGTRELAVIVFLLPWGLMICLGLQGIVGICGLHTRDTRPYEFVMQKGMFLLGAMMLPLWLFPDVLQTVAVVTPFFWSMGGIAQLIFGVSASKMILAVGCTVGWAIAVVYLATLVERSLTRGFLQRGGEA